MKIEDERIEGEKQKISARILGYAYMALWLIVLYRQFILKQELSEYLDIFLLTVGVSIALSLSNIKEGLYLSYRSAKQQKINVLIGTIVSGFVVLCINYFMYGNKVMTSILSSVIFMLFFLLLQLIMLYSSNKKSNKFNEED